MQVALAVRRTQPELTVGVEILRGNRDVARRLDHEQIGLAAGLEFEPIGRAPGDDDVIEVAKRQAARTSCASVPRPEWTKITSSASALRNSSCCGCSGRQRARVTSSLPKSSDPARDRVARAGNRSCLQVMMAQRRLVAEIRRDRPRRLEPDHARRRPQVIDDAVGPREPGERDDFFVVDPLALESRLVADGRCAACAGSSRVADRAAWMSPPTDLVVVRFTDGGRRGCARFPAARSPARRRRRA